jgi:hypothetical protein
MADVRSSGVVKNQSQKVAGQKIAKTVKKKDPPTPIESDDSPSEEEEVPVICKFKPIRGGKNAKPCAKLAINPWGFCGVHNRTNQAKSAKQTYEEEKKREDALQLQKLENELDALNANEEFDEDEPPGRFGLRDEQFDFREKRGSGDGFDDYDDYENDDPQPKLTPNRWGRFEDHDTGIVFDPDKKMAIGIQGHDGKVHPLDSTAIDECIEKGWAYMQPTKKSGMLREEEHSEKSEEEEEAEEITEETDETEGIEGTEEYEDD